MDFSGNALDLSVIHTHTPLRKHGSLLAAQSFSQRLLGHRNLATTARYLCIATSKVCSGTSPLDLHAHLVPTEPKSLRGRKMDRPELEVAEGFRRYGKAYPEQHRVSLPNAQPS